MVMTMMTAYKTRIDRTTKQKNNISSHPYSSLARERMGERAKKKST